MSLIKRIVHNDAVRNIQTYFLINVLQKSIPFLILPIFTRMLSNDDMGNYLLYQSIFQIVIPVLTLGVGSAITIEYYKLEKKVLSNYIFTSIGIALGWSILLIVLSFFLRSRLTEWLNMPYDGILYASLAAFPWMVFSTYQNILRFENNVSKYGVLALIATGLTNGLGFLLLFTTSLSWRAFAISNLIGYFLLMLYGLILLRNQQLIDVPFIKKHVYDILKIGVPSALNSIGGWLENSLSRLLLNILIGASATAVFGIASTFGMVMNLVSDSINLAYVPLVFKKLSDKTKGSRLYLLKFAAFIYGILIVIALSLCIVGYYGVIILFGNKYADSIQFVVPLVVVATINGFYKIHLAYILFSKKTYIVMCITIFSGLLNLGIGYFSIQKYGVMGAVYSTLTTQTVAYILSVIISNRMYPSVIRLHDLLKYGKKKI